MVAKDDETRLRSVPRRIRLAERLKRVLELESRAAFAFADEARKTFSIVLHRCVGEQLSKLYQANNRIFVGEHAFCVEKEQLHIGFERSDSDVVVGQTCDSRRELFVIKIPVDALRRQPWQRKK